MAAVGQSPRGRPCGASRDVHDDGASGGCWGRTETFSPDVVAGDRAHEGQQRSTVILERSSPWCGCVRYGADRYGKDSWLAPVPSQGH